MSRLRDSLGQNLCLELAVSTRSPSFLARVFASFCGQFYSRADFDALARQVSHLYASHDPEDAYSFRSRLDLRLYDRYHDHVVWETEQKPSERSGECR